MTQYTRIDVSTYVPSEVTVVSIKDGTDLSRPSEITEGHIPDFVVRILTLYDGNLVFLRMVYQTKEETLPSTFYVLTRKLSLLDRLLQEQVTWGFIKWL